VTLQKAKVWKTAGGWWGYVMPSWEVEGGVLGGHAARWADAMQAVCSYLAARGTA
jgi:hypothetical protein